MAIHNFEDLLSDVSILQVYKLVRIAEVSLQHLQPVLKYTLEFTVPLLTVLDLGHLCIVKERSFSVDYKVIESLDKGDTFLRLLFFEVIQADVVERQICKNRVWVCIRDHCATFDRFLWVCVNLTIIGCLIFKRVSYLSLLHPILYPFSMRGAYFDVRFSNFI